MATVTTSSNGLRRVMFTWNGTRRTLYVGRLSLKSSEALATLVESLISAKTQGVPLDADTASKVRSLGNDLHDKLSEFRLVDPRPRSRDLLPLIDAYIESRSDWKPNSIRNAKQARRYLASYFKSPVTLDAISEHDAQSFRRWLANEVGENTTRRNCKWASQFLRVAVDMRLIDRNPFAVLKGLTMKPDETRQVYVCRETFGRVLDACPSVEWRLIAVLARYGGLRIPSELTCLTWDCIDWHGKRITVHSPKTGSRIVPLFPEILPHLEAWDEIAEPGTVHLFKRYTTSNLRTHFSRIVERAGLVPWAKLFQNLRASRETELAERYPLHVVCKWIGNSQPVAMRHYLQVTEDHFTQATQLATHRVATPTFPTVHETSQKSLKTHMATGRKRRETTKQYTRQESKNVGNEPEK